MAYVVSHSGSGLGFGQPEPAGWPARLNGFGEPPTPSQATRTETVKVVARSSILPVGSAIGSVPCRLTTAPVPLPGLPVSVPVPTFIALRGAAALLDRFIKDHIRSDAKDRMYRMFSQQSFQVVCQNDQIVSVTPSPIDTDVGQECLIPGRACITPPPMTILGMTLRRTAPDTFTFGWTGKGRPPVAIEPAVEAICPRSARFIWHTVSGTIRCGVSGVMVAVTLRGSRFPTHAVFVNGALRASIPQGPLGMAWVSDPNDSRMVR